MISCGIYKATFALSDKIPLTGSNGIINDIITMYDRLEKLQHLYLIVKMLYEC